MFNGQEVLPSVPIHNISISVSVPQEVKCVRALPEEVEVPFERNGSIIKFTVGKLNIFQMVALEYKEMRLK